MKLPRSLGGRNELPERANSFLPSLSSSLKIIQTQLKFIVILKVSWEIQEGRVKIYSGLVLESEYIVDDYGPHNYYRKY